MTGHNLSVHILLIPNLDRVVEKVLLETGMTEDELVEAFVNQES
jgi:hypothetical protein